MSKVSIPFFALAELTLRSSSIDKLKADIEFLKQEKESRERALASRRAEFAKMVKSVKDLQRAINEERALAVSRGEERQPSKV